MSTEELEQSVPLETKKESNPPEIRIECYLLHARRRNARRDAEDAIVEFDDLLESDTSAPSDPEAAAREKFQRFFVEFIKSFDNKFAVFKGGKAISILSEDVRFDSGTRTISGIVEGGITSMGGFIKDQEHKESEFELTPNHVSGQPYYFLLYLPSNSATGILIFQSFSTNTFSDIFKRKMILFMSEKNGPVLRFESFVPNEVVENFKDHSTIEKITISKHSVSSDKAANIFDMNFIPDEEINIEIKITGNGALKSFQNKIGDWWNHQSDNKRFFALEDLGYLGFDDESEIKFTFDNNGKKNTVTSRNSFKFSPNIYVEEGDIKRDSNFLPIFESVDEYCRGYLGSIIDQIK